MWFGDEGFPYFFCYRCADVNRYLAVGPIEHYLVRVRRIFLVLYL